MLSPETATLLEGGYALIVGTASIRNEPHASRGWGITVVSRDPPSVRLLLDGDDAVAIDHLSTSTKIAVTGGNVRTLHSIQFKGTVGALEPATEEDRTRAARYSDDFFGEVANVDGTPRELLDRLTPRDLVACIVHIDELYDQTPGPGAGAAMAEGAS